MNKSIYGTASHQAANQPINQPNINNNNKCIYSIELHINAQLSE